MVAVAGVAGQADCSVLGGLLIGQVGEVAGDGVVRPPCFADEVQRNGGELAGGPGLKKQDAVVLRDVHQPAQLVLGLLEDVHKYLRSVAHLHHGHAGAPIIGDLRSGPLQYGQREDRWSGGKVVDAGIAHWKEPLS